jgi:alpha-galactosidase
LHICGGGQRLVRSLNPFAAMRYPPRALVLSAACLMACLCRVALRGEGVDGLWRIDSPKRGGVTLRTFLKLHQDGAALTGAVYANSSFWLKLHDARMEGTTAVFRVDWGWTFHVMPDGKTLLVNIAYDGGGSDQLTAVPADPAETAPPAAVPLPEVQDVPSNGLARTPPMGWNSWNHFAERVDDKVVREVADTMVSSGMAAAGYQYVNIDDTWEAGRDAQGAIVPNTKFPDMKALADYVHAKGLKLGIYSSPGYVTCGGYPGSYGHEEQDARTFAAWGIDYLKYDWCSASQLYPNSGLQASYQKMGLALLASGRPIVYSLCEYGTAGVWGWGPKVDGNLWRTTGDIQDHWKSMEKIGFDQGRLAPYAGPGHWNDPDMLEVGNGGMTATEYRTHFSLWCMLAAPLIAGNDLRTMSEETRDILTNREVIAVDQDPLGREATRVMEQDGVEIWVKPMQDGSRAVGVFNRNADERTASFTWAQLGLAQAPGLQRDLWRHANAAPAAQGFSGAVAGHGVAMLLIKGG